MPGTTIVGIMGLLIGGYGIFRSYDLYGNSAGHMVFGVAAVLTIAATIFSFKSNAWKKLALKGSIDSRVNENLTINLSVGLEGVTASSLKPVGKAEFDNQEFEVSSLGNFVEEKKDVRIIKIERNKVFVEPINQD